MHSLVAGVRLSDPYVSPLQALFAQKIARRPAERSLWSQAQTRGPQKRVGRAESRCALHGLEGGSRGGGAARLPSRAPESGWQKRKGRTECVPTASGTRHLEGYKLTALLGEREGWRTTGGRVVGPRTTELSWRGTKALASTISLAHPPAKIPKGTSSWQGNCLHRTNTQCCASVDPSLQRGSDSLPVPQGPC